MTVESNHSQKRILQWALGISAVLLLFTTMATIGVLWRMRKDSQTAVPAPQVPTAAANWSSATFTAKADDGVRQTSDKSWSVKGGSAIMNVRRKDDDSLELRFVYPFDGDWLPKETVMLVRTRWGLNDVAKLADELSITPEQLADLKAVSPATDMPVPSTEKRRLRALFEDYLTAKDAATEHAVIAALVDLDNTYYEQTRERIEAIAQQVKSIFNPEQLAALSQRFGGRNR